MKISIFGLTVSSSWGNGHATLWRGLIRAFARRGWRVVFFERDVPYYAGARDLGQMEDADLVLYSDWPAIRQRAAREVADADVAIVTSYCPDALPATQLVLEASTALRVFYDLDTPVTLSNLKKGQRPEYIGPNGLSGFDLALSYTGGAALQELSSLLGAPKALPFYGHVDPDKHHPEMRDPCFAGDLSYLGTYAADRQEAIERFLVEPAWRRPECRFVIAGAQYPQDFPWAPNIYFVRHLPPPDHPRFFTSSRLTLNVTRRAMAEMGWCPSGRLFEAAACGAAIVTDVWPGLDNFFTPGREVLPVETTEDVIAALALTDQELNRVRENARERVLTEHTSDRRATEFEAIVADAKRCTAAISEVA